jgi:hypothetical protein
MVVSAMLLAFVLNVTVFSQVQHLVSQQLSNEIPGGARRQHPRP